MAIASFTKSGMIVFARCLTSSASLESFVSMAVITKVIAAGPLFGTMH